MAGSKLAAVSQQNLTTMDKTKRRLEMKRASAHNCRERKRKYVEELEQKIAAARTENVRLTGEVEAVRREVDQEEANAEVRAPADVLTPAQVAKLTIAQSQLAPGYPVLQDGFPFLESSEIPSAPGCIQRDTQRPQYIV